MTINPGQEYVACDRSGYLLASLVDEQWESHPAAQGGLYRAQNDRIRNRASDSEE